MLNLLEKKRRNISNSQIAIILFFLFVTIFVVNDKIVHSDLYNYGLQFSYSWANSYWINYNLMYQLSILSLFLYCRSKTFLIFAETFVLSATQDILFFVLVGGFPSGEWWWMWQYSMFGTWTTAHQLLTSAVFLAVAGAIIVYKKRLPFTQS